MSIFVKKVNCIEKLSEVLFATSFEKQIDFRVSIRMPFEQ